MQKREFIKTLALAGISLPLAAKNTEEMFHKFQNYSASQMANDDEFWNNLRGIYKLKTDYINLENGYYSMMPQTILNDYIAEIKLLNFHASYYMRKKMTDDKIAVRQNLAQYLKCELNEIIVTRNTTEAMNTVICGMDWKAGDEAIMAYQDYGAMLDMFKQQGERYGIINKIINIPNHPKSDDEMVALYENAITKNTKLLMVCHMINITGQILPVRKICDMAHQHNVKVVVDGAHAIAHFDFKISDLNCDYYASSLHKWLSVPLGAGLLYVKNENIENLWPVNGEYSYDKKDIRKLNHTGTQPMATELSIAHAIKYNELIGIKRKEERLRYLKNYWVNKVKEFKNIEINTPFDNERSCGIANVGVKNLKPAYMAQILFDKYKIWTVAIDNPKANVQGCRITPGIFTTIDELNVLVNALKEMSA
ncbi:MAG: aminotransferase class V-fold PLP-dependent enzyme [Bacteroidia bacterium]